MTDSRVFISEADAYLFGQGTHYDIYKKLGAHPSQENGEKGYYFLTFGNDYTEDNLNYLLTSIEDHGYSIPDMNFWFNRETADFLEGKEIYFNVEDEKINGKTMYNIKRILLLSEFEGEDSGESFEDDYDPFSNED